MIDLQLSNSYHSTESYRNCWPTFRNDWSIGLTSTFKTISWAINLSEETWPIPRNWR